MPKNKKIYKNFEAYLGDELKNPEMAVAYLNEAFSDKDQTVFLLALNDVLKAQNKGVTELADDTQLNRQSVHRMLSKQGNPRWKSMKSLLVSLGIQVNFSLKKEETETHPQQDKQ